MGLQAGAAFWGVLGTGWGLGDPRAAQIPAQALRVCSTLCYCCTFPRVMMNLNSFPRIVVLVNKAVLDAGAGNGVGNPWCLSALRGFLILSSRKSSCRYCRALIART